ncbi:MAG: hypothetical protein AB8G05_13585 [Oligoflexales bacterium]
MDDLLTLEIETVSINNLEFNKVMIDWKHISERHPDISQELVLQAIFQLDGKHFVEDSNKPPYMYFVSLLKLNEKMYKLVWLLEERGDYVGVLNLYRDDRKK